MRASAAKRLKKSSSGPKRIDGRMMVVEGCAASTRCSAVALERLYMLDEFASAPIADTWTMRAPWAFAASATCSAP
jgi:hypothetical protein